MNILELVLSILCSGFMIQKLETPFFINLKICFYSNRYIMIVKYLYLYK